MADPVSMVWQDVLFAHWPVRPERLRPLVPDALSVDTYDGRAWVGAIPFRMVDLRTSGSPFTRTFAELNFRTYVRHGDEPGVYFFSLDAPDSVVVRLSRWMGLPYHEAEVRLRERGDAFEFACRRTHAGTPPARFVATYRQKGPLETPDADSLAAFLVERTNYYLDGDEGLSVGHVYRDPFTVAPATVTVHSNSMLSSVGLDDSAGDPRFWYAAPDGLAVTADRIRPVEDG